MATTKKISDEVRDVLASMDIEHLFDGEVHSYNARITDGQLPRDLYVAVDKTLKAIEGKWNRSAKGHIFAHDPGDAIDEIVLTGAYTDKKQAFQFFETPEALAEELVAAAEIADDMRVL
jgi:hypothetical protein